ncbi:MAG: hypothetical protein K2W85_10005 [Phycisphaerales bacterium]|nr:hypothetical protein [Phycisphaerales bacterium]
MSAQGPNREYRGGFGDGPPRSGRAARVVLAVVAVGVIAALLLVYWK